MGKRMSEKKEERNRERRLKVGRAIEKHGYTAYSVSSKREGRFARKGSMIKDLACNSCSIRSNFSKFYFQDAL